jgi:hypothetical protein
MGNRVAPLTVTRFLVTPQPWQKRGAYWFKKGVFS